MSSLEIAYQLRRLTMDSSSSSVPPPPESLCSSSISSPSHCELDLCSRFNDMSQLPPLTPSPSCYSMSSQESQGQSESTGSIKGWGSTISRSRCFNNLSSLGCAAPESSLSREISTCNEGWGYFADVPPNKRRRAHHLLEIEE